MMSRFGYPYGGEEVRAQFARAVERAVSEERARTQAALHELERYRQAVRELRAALDEARAELDEARAAPRELRAELDEVRAELGEAQAELARVRGERDDARAELARVRSERDDARDALAEQASAAQHDAPSDSTGPMEQAQAGEPSSSPEVGDGGDAVQRLRLQQQVLARDLAAVRRRQAEEVERARRAERLATVKPWFAVLDDLDRALAAHPDAGPDDPWLQGLQAVRRRGEEALRRLGVERVDPRGEPFDPEQHEALARVPAPPGVAEGTVVDVHQAGYRAADGELLRPAKVLVAGA